MSDLHQISRAIDMVISTGQEDELRRKIEWLRGFCERHEIARDMTQPGTDRSVANDSLASGRAALIRVNTELEGLTEKESQ